MLLHHRHPGNELHAVISYHLKTQPDLTKFEV